MTQPDLWNLLPSVRRGRGYRIYGDDGNRYLDLYQDNGRCILGHRPGRVFLELKSSLSKGLVSAYPSSSHQRRLEKAIHMLIPGFSDYRLYTSDCRAEQAISAYFDSGSGEEVVVDPVLDNDKNKTSLWRPFLEHLDWNQEVLLPVLPFPMGLGICIVLFRNRPPPQVPISDPIAPFLLAGLRKAIYDLMIYTRECNRENWEHFDSGPWHRIGPYLVAEGDRESYKRIFEECLSGGILLSPKFPGPSIIPGEFTVGELKVLDRLARR